ncbi:unnamed protein product [Durusdinium trenchii]|uniref:Uncharacterized protein n=1 Tax=Durusdinium trenchii TaxID=1381693 RepID=A0ABP0HVE1_9DINO
MLLRGIAFATWFAELVTLILYVIVALQNGQQTHPKLIVLLTFVAIILGIHQCNWYMLVVFRLLMNSNKRIRGQLMRASRITFRIINVVCVSLFIVGGVALLTSSAEAKAVNAIMLWFNVGFWLVLAMLAIRTVETLQQVIVQFESVLEIEKNDSVATFVRRLRNMQRVVIGSVLVALLAIGSSVVLGFGFDWNPSLIFFSMPFTKVLFAIVMWFLLHKFEARPKSVQPPRTCEHLDPLEQTRFKLAEAQACHLQRAVRAVLAVARVWTPARVRAPEVSMENFFKELFNIDDDKEAEAEAKKTKTAKNGGRGAAKEEEEVVLDEEDKTTVSELRYRVEQAGFRLVKEAELSALEQSQTDLRNQQLLNKCLQERCGKFESALLLAKGQEESLAQELQVLKHELQQLEVQEAEELRRLENCQLHNNKQRVLGHCAQQRLGKAEDQLAKAKDSEARLAQEHDALAAQVANLEVEQTAERRVIEHREVEMRRLRVLIQCLERSSVIRDRASLEEEKLASKLKRLQVQQEADQTTLENRDSMIRKQRVLIEYMQQCCERLQEKLRDAERREGQRENQEREIHHMRSTRQRVLSALLRQRCEHLESSLEESKRQKERLLQDHATTKEQMLQRETKNTDDHDLFEEEESKEDPEYKTRTPDSATTKEDEEMFEQLRTFEPLESFQEATDAGVHCFGLRQFNLAKLHFFQARHLALEAQDLEAEAKAEGNISNVYSSMDEPQHALVHFKRSLFLLRKIGDVDLEGVMLSNGIICCIQLERFDEAMGLAVRKMAIASDPKGKAEAEEWISKINTAVG